MLTVFFYPEKQVRLFCRRDIRERQSLLYFSRWKRTIQLAECDMSESLGNKRDTFHINDDLRAGPQFFLNLVTQVIRRTEICRQITFDYRDHIQNNCFQSVLLSFSTRFFVKASEAAVIQKKFEVIRVYFDHEADIQGDGRLEDDDFLELNAY